MRTFNSIPTHVHMHTLSVTTGEDPRLSLTLPYGDEDGNKVSSVARLRHEQTATVAE